MYSEGWMLFVMLSAVMALAYYTTRKSFTEGYEKGYGIGRSVGTLLALQACIQDELISIDDKGIPVKYNKKFSGNDIMELNDSLVPPGVQKIPKNELNGRTQAVVYDKKKRKKD